MHFAPAPATRSAAGWTLAPTSPIVSSPPRARAAASVSRAGFGQSAVRLGMRQKQYGFHGYSSPIQADDFACDFFRPACSSRCVFPAVVWAGLTEAKARPLSVLGAGLARCNAGMMPRMLAMPTWGLLRGSGKWPGGPSHHRRVGRRRRKPDACRLRCAPEPASCHPRGR